MPKFDSEKMQAPCDCNERRSLCAMVDAFAVEMKAKLLQKVDEGYTGWDASWFEIEGEDGIKERLVAHVDKDNPVDVANFACFWWNKL